MAARTIPTLPTWAAGQRVLASNLAAMVSYHQFWADPPMFRMYQSVVQSIPNAAYTQITCDTLDYDTDTGRAAGTPWSYTIPVGMTGRWQVGGVVGFTANSTGSRYGLLYRNGSQIAATQVPLPGAAASTEIVITDTFLLNAGDVLALYGYQSSGGALNTDTGHCVFWGRLVSLGNP